MEAQIFEKGKKVTRKHDEKISFWVSQELWDAITGRATSKHCSVSAVMRTTVDDHLLKEINDANLIVEHMPKIMRKLERLQGSVELSSELFIYWLKYFFAYYVSELPSEEIQVKKIKSGEMMKNQMLEHFKKHKTENKKSWLEQLIMEYFEFGSSEGGTIG
jgi:hypothetical protein